MHIHFFFQLSFCFPQCFDGENCCNDSPVAVPVNPVELHGGFHVRLPLSALRTLQVTVVWSMTATPLPHISCAAFSNRRCCCCCLMLFLRLVGFFLNLVECRTNPRSCTNDQQNTAVLIGCSRCSLRNAVCIHSDVVGCNRFTQRRNVRAIALCSTVISAARGAPNDT